MNNELISVILPIYNVEKYLRRSIESVIKQKYKNLEIILVNDGSSDSSPNICEEYKEKDKRITVIHKENGGLSSARNAGVDRAKGEIIAFLDADDFISNEFLWELFRIMNKYNADIAECNVEKVDEDKVQTYQFKDETKDDSFCLEKYEALKRIHDDDFSICLRSVIASNKLYKKKLFKETKYPLNKLHEDEFTTFKLYYNATKVAFTNKKMYAYVQRKNSIMHKEFSLRRLDALEAYDNYMHFFIEKEMIEMQARTCRRYLRLLTIIKNEVKESKYEDKEAVIKTLNNKFNYICNFIDQLVKRYPELAKRKEMCEEFIQKYNEV